MHKYTMVIKVADFKSEAQIESWGQWGHLEAAMTSEATKTAVGGIKQILLEIQLIYETKI